MYTIAPAAPMMVYSGAPGACTASAPVATSDYFTGTLIPLTEFVAGVESVD